MDSAQHSVNHRVLVRGGDLKKKKIYLALVSVRFFPASSVLCPCQDHSPYDLGPANLPEDKHWELCPTNCLSNICTRMLSRFNCV